MKYVFGVDVGGTTIKLGLLSEEGELLRKKEIPTCNEKANPQLFVDIKDAVNEIAGEEGIAMTDVKGVGIGVPGPVLSDGTVLGLTNIDIGVCNVAKLMEELTGIPTKVGNDANLAALGEMWQGAGVGHSNLVMVTLGTGVGGGVVIDGNIIYGQNGGAGEIGHLPVVHPGDEHDMCGCGKRGCLEQYASATGIVKVAKKRIVDSGMMKSKLLTAPEITAKVVFDAANEGDRLALDIVNEVCEYLGKGIAMITCVLDPEIILIGGGVSAAGGILVATTSEHYRKYAFHASADTEFGLATLGNDAGIYGAAKLML